MAIGWFLAPYVRHPTRARMRYCIVNDLTSVIRSEGGDWTETEVLGQEAIVKVRASPTTLTQVAGLAGVTRIPVALLDDPLSTLTAQQKTAIRNRVIALGYTTAEINAALPGDLGSFTLRQLLQFVTQRRRKVRYDEETDSIIDDGPDEPVRPIDSVDSTVV